MRKDRFYYPQIDELVISDKNIINKIKNVLRKKAGDELIIFDGNGKEYWTTIAKVEKRSLVLGPLKEFQKQDKSKVELHLAFSLIKAQKVDILLQKCVELGIDEFHPFISEYSNMKEPGQAKISHFEHVIEEAAAQSRRLWVAKFNNVLDSKSLEESFSSYDFIVLADPYETVEEDELKAMFNSKESAKILFLVGPEGGFSPDELQRFSSCSNLIKYKFSNFVLRAETAAIVLTAQIANLIDKKS